MDPAAGSEKTLRKDSYNQPKATTKTSAPVKV